MADILSLKRSKFPLETLFKKFLKQYNCRATSEDMKDNGARRYVFDYQGGHFVAVFYDNYTYELLFLNILDVPVANLNLLRSLCNRFNAASIFLKYYYRNDEEVESLHVHLAMLCSTVDQTLPQRLELFFSARRDFIDEYEQQLKAYENSEAFDLESNFLQQRRESALAGERALALAQQPMPRGNAVTPLTVGSLLDAAGFAPAEMPRVGIEFCAEMGHYKSKGYKLIDYVDRHPLIDSLQVKDGVVGRKNATIVLHKVVTKPLDEDEENSPAVTQHNLENVGAIILTYCGSDGDTIYYKATVAPAPQPDTRNGGEATPRPVTFTLAHDLVDPKKKLAEFDYMWKEAKSKAKEKNPTMSDEEILLAHFDDPDAGMCLYWGHRYLSQERYLEALECFLSIYNALSPDFFTLNNDKQEAFLEVCYLIGCCYNALKQYDRAFFHLDHLRGSSKIAHCVEYVNTLVNCGDIRAFAVIDGIYGSIKDEHSIENEEDEDALPQHIKDFVDFLRIRRADACVTFHELDNAEKEYKLFLDHPTLGNHALDQLALIKRLRTPEQSPPKQP